MLLAINVNNTYTKIGVYAGTRLALNWRLQTDPGRTADEYGVLLLGLFEAAGAMASAIDAVVVSSVVPPMNAIIDELARKFFRQEPVQIGPGIRTGMPILMDNPKEVGADRIVNAVAGYDRVRAACIVVDFGTATTFDYVSARGEYAGGVIVPGIAISLDALFLRTAKLPRVELVRPPRVVGRGGASVEVEGFGELDVLGVLPVGGALLEEGHHALDGVGEAAGPPRDVGFLLEGPRAVELLEVAVDEPLDDRHRRRGGVGGDVTGKLQRRR